MNINEYLLTKVILYYLFILDIYNNICFRIVVKAYQCCTALWNFSENHRISQVFAVFLSNLGHLRGAMGALVTVRELSKQLGIKESKVRRWTKQGLLTPISKSKQDGRSFLYDIDCAWIKLEILDRIRIDFASLSEIAARFREIFGRRDSDLLEALHTTDNRKELVKKYIEEIRSHEGTVV